MFTKIKTAVLVFLLVFSVPGYSSDENTGAYADYSPSCGGWVVARQQMTLDNIGGKLSHIITWMSGYITHYNFITPDTYDIVVNTDFQSIYLWLDNYCRDNPLDNLAYAMNALTAELYPNRTRTAPTN